MDREKHHRQDAKQGREAERVSDPGSSGTTPMGREQPDQGGPGAATSGEERAGSGVERERPGADRTAAMGGSEPTRSPGFPGTGDPESTVGTELGEGTGTKKGSR